MDNWVLKFGMVFYETHCLDELFYVSRVEDNLFGGIFDPVIYFVDQRPQLQAELEEPGERGS
jgi:hypothetical protein